MGKTAIIVEDEIFVALDLERILTDAGYSVVGIAADRSTACDIGRGCDFAFVDVNLRDGPTGPDIAATLARDHDVKIVFVTANPAQIAGHAQALGYVRKPFSEAAITAAAAIASGGLPLPQAANDVVLFADRRGEIRA
uniref:response regulator n=1 Tax=Sphingomonas bacterium TaxID=1895847 RepID=UPI0026023DC4|nr:response regulator [Sphingomonas bacterium]